MDYTQFIAPYQEAARSAANAGGAQPILSDYYIKPGESGDIAENYKRFDADTAAWQARYDSAFNPTVINNAYQNAENPWVQVTQSQNGVPGVSLRQSDYNDQIAKYKAYMPSDNQSDPLFNTNFAGWLRNNNSPSMFDNGTRSSGTAIAQNSYGLNQTNQELSDMSNQFIDARNAAKFKPGRAITGLARGLVLSGLGASAVGALTGGLTALPTGVSAGSSAGSLFGNSLGNFATNAAIKGAISGGVSGLTSGQGLGDILKGAGLSALTAGFAPGLGSSLGLGNAATQGLSGAISGAANNYLSGGNPLTGALTGGAGSYLLNGGKLPGIGSLPGELGAGGMGPPAPGSGVLGSIGRFFGETGVNAGEDMANKNWYDELFSKDTLGSIAGAGISAYSNKKTADALNKGQKNALAALQPYLNQQFGMDDFQADPGYQFQLAEGQKALDRSNAAKGSYYSGNALREAGEYSTGLANQTYNDAFSRWLQQQQNGMSGAVQQGNIYTNIGNANANAITNTGNAITGGLANILGTRGLNTAGQSNQQASGLDQLLELLKSKGIR